MLYELSKKYAPPVINLRQAEIMDSYGDEEYAKIQLNHVNPEDVKLEELLYYNQAWGFMNAKDLLFYAYAVTTFADSGDKIFVEMYIYTIEQRLSRNDFLFMIQDDQGVFKEALKELLTHCDVLWLCPAIDDFLKV